MGSRKNLPKKTDDDIRQILKNAGAPQAAICIEAKGERKHWTVTSSDEGESLHNIETDDTTIYGIGSQTKLLIILLLSIMIDKLPFSADPAHEPYRAFRRKCPTPWDEKFTVIFEKVTGVKLLPLPRDPTLRYVALHYNAFPPGNHFTLALDGTSIMSKQSFFKVAPRLANITYKDSTDDYVSYSNSGYILIGYMIESIGQNSLAELIKLHLFDPLGMTKTYMEAPRSNDSHIAYPHTISANGSLHRVSPWLYTVNSIITAAFGAFSCTRDMAILFSAILNCVKGDESMFTTELVKHLLLRSVKLPGTDDYLSLFGVYTTMDSATLGSKSYNRLVVPEDKYALGYWKGRKKVGTYYIAGTTKGYASCSYLLPNWNLFIVVLTNSTPFTDAADHISRLILQKCLNLHFSSPLIPKSLTTAFRKHKGESSHVSESTQYVDVVAVSARGSAAGKKLLYKLVTEDADQDIPNPKTLRLDGRYYNKSTDQSIVIKDNQAQLLGTADGALGTPRPMGIIRTGHFSIRLRPLSESDFTIDRHDLDSWQNLSLQLTTEKNKLEDEETVILLTRNVGVGSNEYERLVDPN